MVITARSIETARSGNTAKKSTTELEQEYNMRNYWAFRVDKRYLSELNEELEKGRLRQGWGWDERQNLNQFTLNEGASRNFPILNGVKKNDIILIPHLPHWGLVSIAEATEDWNSGYRFGIFKTGDHGHIFPAKRLKYFSRHNENVTGNIRSTLRTPNRFWNISHYSDDINNLLSVNDECIEPQGKSDRLIEAVVKSFVDVQNHLISELNAQFNASEWEYVLVDILTVLYPHCTVERVGGKLEAQHGTDILITIPGITSDTSYCIAVQIKDWNNHAGLYPVNQVLKADYWNNDSRKVIEKIVLLIRAEEKNNESIIKYASENGVKIIFSSDLNEMVFKYACLSMGKQSDES